MRIEISEIQYILDESKLLGKERRDALTIGLSHTIAYSLQIPTSAEVDLRSYYHETHSAEVNRLLTSINEELVIDVRRCQDLVFQFFKQRFDICHRPEVIGKEIWNATFQNVLNQEPVDGEQQYKLHRYLKKLVTQGG